jgi:hypothetical protein
VPIIRKHQVGNFLGGFIERIDNSKIDDFILGGAEPKGKFGRLFLNIIACSNS